MNEVFTLIIGTGVFAAFFIMKKRLRESHEVLEATKGKLWEEITQIKIKLRELEIQSNVSREVLEKLQNYSEKVDREEAIRRLDIRKETQDFPR